MGALVRVLVACMVLSLAACEEAFDPDAFVQHYVELHRARDIDGLLALHTDDAEFVIPGQNAVRGRKALRDLFEWDAVLDARLEMRDIHMEGDTIRVDTIIESNRFFEALGLPEVRYQPGTRFVLRDGLIAAVHAADLDEETLRRGLPAYQRLMAWLAANRPDDLARLMPDGKFRYDAESARRWLEVLEEWKRSAGSDPPEARPSTVLDRLVGTWSMTGRLLDEEVEYSLEVERVLGGAFVVLHMKDVAEPPEYEAIVYIAPRDDGRSLVAHWLDVFGADPSAVLGFGSATEDRLELLFDYPERPFRDTIEFDRRRGEWSFLIEYRPEDGDWKTFAEYAVLPEGDGAPSRPDSGR